MRKKRLDLKIYQKDLARELDVSVSSIIDWEKGNTTPCVAFLPKIIEFLGYLAYEPTDEEDLGGRVRRARRALGLTQKKLARLLRVDPATIEAWERGRHRPSEKLKKRLEEFLAQGPSNSSENRE